ncbi:MAG: hypothetical protein AAGO57_00920 [Pseudomonadota bacterium]
MDAIYNRLPSLDSLQSVAPKLAAFAMGGLVTLMLGLLVSVIYTGTGFGQAPAPVEQIYTNF